MEQRQPAVEDLGLNSPRECIDATYWRGRRVLITGLTGFKGAWLGLWLSEMGAQVSGLSLAPDTEPNLFRALELDRRCDARIGDIRELAVLAAIVRETRPQAVFHLAAQSQVLESHRDPVQTFGTNLMGTVHLMEALREVHGVEAIVVATTDKVYENRNWEYSYREGDVLGGSDPYSGSKACAEIAVRAYRESFAAQLPGVATVRAGNVVGGGDGASARLVPDAARAFARGNSLELRNPNAVRPWQHVVDPLAGYLMLARALAESNDDVQRAWNFGPDTDQAATVLEVVTMFAEAWGDGATRWVVGNDQALPEEHPQLLLDSGLARRRLGWRPRFDVAETLCDAAQWYRASAQGADAGVLRAQCLKSIERWYAAD